MSEASEEVYSSLHRRFKGDLLRPGASGFEGARAIWNGMVARTPGLIARCSDVSDVQNAIQAPPRLEFLPQFVAEGTALQGLARGDGGMVIDLSRMRQVTVIPKPAGRGSQAAVCWDRLIPRRKRQDWFFPPASSPIPALPD